jgi:hypothetical protein
MKSDVLQLNRRTPGAGLPVYGLQIGKACQPRPSRRVSTTPTPWERSYARMSQRDGDSAPGLRCRHVLCVAVLLCLPTTLPAQDSSQPDVAFAADSSRATGAACKVVLSLRQEPQRYRCYVESFKETPTEYLIRVREVSLDGAQPPPFHRSTVRLQKTKPSVTVTRVPDL